MKLTTSGTQVGTSQVLVDVGNDIGQGVAEAIEEKLKKYYLIAGVIIIFFLIKK